MMFTWLIRSKNYLTVNFIVFSSAFYDSHLTTSVVFSVQTEAVFFLMSQFLSNRNIKQNSRIFDLIKIPEIIFLNCLS